MSNIDETNKADEPAEDANVQSAELSPETGRARRPLFIRAAAIAGAAGAVVAVLGLTFGAGVWAGSEFGDDYGRDDRGHSESRSHQRDSHDNDDDIDERGQQDAAERACRGDAEGKSSKGEQVHPGGERIQAPASSSAAPVPAQTTSGRL
ncbi:hypothetical protein [Mycobacteroides abscessus]|uniref:hypothetical protein n=7 Tax=Mycobacteroides abscessus TaxID=36809 RepID=UPI00069691E1|nr:hypothetical protein [Mycobacteroides abscessus]